MRDNKKTRKFAFKGIFSYLLALGFSVIFGLFLSGTIGWFFFTVMLFLPFVSCGAALLAARKLEVRLSVSETRLYKGEKTELTIAVNNNFILPSPPVEIILTQSEALTCGGEGIRHEICAMPRSSEEMTIPFTAKMWYPTSITVESVYVMDYIGIFPIKLKHKDVCFGIDIIPDIKEVPAAGELIKCISTASGGDDAEDSSDVRALGFTGTPGFEHREYVPGDPVKRINWKMSCKRDTLMIRLDEELLSSRHTFILDRVNAGRSAKNGEICGEYMLGTLAAAVRSGLNAEVWFHGKEWQCFDIAEENDISALRFALAGYRFTEDTSAERIPYSRMSEHSGKKISAVIFFTPCFDKSAALTVKPGTADSKTDTAVIAAAASVGSGVNAAGAWLISEDGSADII